MQIMGAMIKTYWAEKMSIDPKKIFSVAVMPCTAKKYECERNGTMSASGYQDVDAVITTREFANYIRQAGIEFNALEEQKADSPEQERYSVQQAALWKRLCAPPIFI